MKPVALLTSRELKDLIPDELHLVSALASISLTSQPVIWNEETNWAQYSAVIIRNPWDYFEHQEEFFAVLAKINKETKLFNPYSLVKWNLDKNYLFDLKNKGGELPPTIKVTSKMELLNAITHSSFDELVIKPLISAGAYLTYRFNKNNTPMEVLNLPVDKYEFMIQPFLPDIQTEGEYSFIFLAGKFSHAIVKKPKTGDFRVQSEFGGTVTPYEPSPAELKLGEFIFSILPEIPLYARIDLARYEGNLKIMEVELLEPELFFRIKPEAALTMAKEVKLKL